MNKTLIIFAFVLFLLAIVIVIWASYFRNNNMELDPSEELVAGKIDL